MANASIRFSSHDDSYVFFPSGYSPFRVVLILRKGMESSPGGVVWVFLEEEE